jgi:glycogen operon protein
VLRRRGFFRGRLIRGSDTKDISWFRDDGEEMSEGDWDEGHRRALAVHLAGAAADLTDERGELLSDNSLLLFFNAADSEVTFQIPDRLASSGWRFCLDTANPSRPEEDDEARSIRQPASITLQPKSLVVFKSEALADT